MLFVLLLTSDHEQFSAFRSKLSPLTNNARSFGTVLTRYDGVNHSAETIRD
jgi:hypothetical protein